MFMAVNIVLYRVCQKKVARLLSILCMNNEVSVRHNDGVISAIKFIMKIFPQELEPV